VFYVAHEKFNPALLVAGSLVVAMASFYWIEQPSRRFLNGWMKRNIERRTVKITPKYSATI